MKAPAPLLALCLLLLFCAAEMLLGQTVFVGRDHFPAEFEFRELAKIRSDRHFDGAALPADLAESPFFAELGCLKYSERSYDLAGGGTLSIEVLSFQDERGAFSSLTLFRSPELAAGPPGETYSVAEKFLSFAAANFWVRIRGDLSPALMKRVALSVSNRIGLRERPSGLLISHFPAEGLNPSSVRFFLGPRGFASFASPLSGFLLKFRPEVEIAQAGYRLADQAGVLSLVAFPTSQMSEEYFDGLAPSEDSGPKGEMHTYARRIGPLVSLLEGNFSPETADRILGAMRYRYMVKWIYDKNNPNSHVVWGVPVALLGTVVRSLAFTALMCILSILVGGAMAGSRILLRRYAPGNYFDRPERTELIRLRLAGRNARKDSSSEFRGPENAG